MQLPPRNQRSRGVDIFDVSARPISKESRMNKVIVVVIMLFVLNVVLNACTPGGGGDGVKASDSCGAQTTGAEFAGIVNGKTLSAGNAFSSRVVGIVMMDAKGDISGICTGSLLPGNVVLTAAHCVDDNKMGIVFSTNWECSGKNTQVRAVVQKAVHPQANNGDSVPNDLALLKFSGDVPSGYTPFQLPNSHAHVRQSEKMVMVGYGRTGFSKDNDLKLRITSKVAQSDQTYAYLTKDNKEILVVEQKDTGVCKGDSGGPLIVVRQGVPQVVGVTSRVANPDAPESALCSGVGVYVDTSAHADWIRQTHARMTR